MKKIGLIPNKYKDVNLECTLAVLEYLSKKDCIIYLPEEYKERINGFDIKKTVYIAEKALYSEVEFVIPIGGDGTILEVSHRAAPNGLPILGINMGTVGFMTELEVSDINLIDAVFNSDYRIEDRMMLDVSLERDGKSVFTYCALNDVVLFKGLISKLIEINFYCNNDLATTYRADGLIVATPTGSTAYSLSAGGAVIDTKIEGICVTPISSNAFLNSFPMVYSAENEIVLEVARERDEETYLSVDGMENVKVLYGDKIRIRKSALTTKLIRIKKTAFYEALYKKTAEKR